MGYGYFLLYKENSDVAANVNVQLFIKKENAQKEMHQQFEIMDKTLHFSKMQEDDTHFVQKSEDSISVCDGIDEYVWEVVIAVPEDADEELLNNGKVGIF